MKKTRHAKILELISKENIGTQESLIEKLREAGYNVTQATVSRDIKQLKLIKTLSAEGVYKYVCSNRHNVSERLQSILIDSIIKTDYAMNTIVLKCHTGMANAACAAIDSWDFDDIVGTIAGDDTVFILMRCENDAKLLLQEIDDLVINR